MRSLDKLLIGPGFVVVRLRAHGWVSGHVYGVLPLDRLGDEVVNGDGATSVRVEGKFNVVSIEGGRKRE